ncbi:MAG: SLC13 family permease [Gammaproteobacteria bacterium]|nr:SLC13 family permease [Gammaproteobacteria bacterium]MCW8841239.1 SLC13 family permease [Gammaproteobacteria bacterium]MCW8972479.1 SLC13 family permease [Gammaproteobacteria bacterium]MCW8992171.1 SLC13 family permease [Gammaproteobacteria bacterium]
MNRRQRTGLFLGPLFFLVLLFVPLPDGMSPEARAVAAVVALMAVWWISEALPMAATALLPIVLFPLLGVMSTAETTSGYANHLIYLFLGGFLIAMAMQKWELHRRIALLTISLVGTNPPRVILGFMLATGFLSMWISNTATAMMMLPIGLAVISSQQAEGEHGTAGFAPALMLAIAYSASIGGVATLIGTPPNAILAGVLEEMTGTSIGFADWLLFAFPLSALMLALAWLYLTRIAYPSSGMASGQTRELIRSQLKALGPLSRQEAMVLAVFSSVAAAWILRGLLDLPWLEGVTDATIAMVGAIALFILPADWKRGEFLLDWQSALKLPWEIIILFGGGFALASGFAESGLTTWVVNRLGGLQGVSIWLLIAAVTLLVIFLTEVTSNTATATIVLPVMGALAAAMEVAPTVLMIPAAIAASFAFMLPVATPPNAIVFGGGHLTVPQMARAGLWMNLLATLVITLFVLFSSPL